jgi:hypothetical protein
VPLTAARRTALAVRLDLAIFAVGAAVAVPSVVVWVTRGGTTDLAGIVAIALIVVMSRFPLSSPTTPATS